jgi:lipoprotein-releasing system permease protein
MKASSFIAGKLRFSGTVAMVSIAISFVIMIVAVSISSGFRHEIRNGISFIAGDIQLLPVDMNYYSDADPVPARPSYRSKLDSIDGIRSIDPVVYRAGMVKDGTEISGVLFKGLPDNPEILSKVGLLSSQDSSSVLEAAIPEKLAKALSIGEGDSMLAYFVGARVKVRKFYVKSIYKGILNVGDNMMVYAHLSDMQKINGWRPGQVSALEIMLDDRHRSASATKKVADEAGSIALMYASENEPTLVSSSAISKYPQLFDWLGLIDSNVFFILALMTIVAGFNMISGLLIMLFRHISTIGTLKTLGMTDRDISNVFLKVSSHLIIKGMAIGNLLALSLCGIQGLSHWIKLNPENYSVSFIPVHIDPWLILGADISAYAIIMLLLLVPSLFISRIDPADTVRVN